ncbi:amino acid permease [Streptomyces sp. NPDC090075]|uniref:amino acid permease n=1 Tax=Streptomyces sp. NPDC090075 TaxID=3365937 RepID=UPI003803B8BF
MSRNRTIPATSSDDVFLARLGIKPELSRRTSPFQNRAISISVICILAGGMSLFGFGMSHGGPVVMLGTWLAVGFFTLLVGMALADVVSAYPTSGGPYFMAEKLGGAGWGWLTGGLNLLGLLGAIAGIDYGAAQFIGAFIQLQWGIAPTTVMTLLIFGVILGAHGLLNSTNVRVLNVLNSISVWWQLGGVVLIVGALMLSSAPHQSPSFLLTFHNESGISSTLQVVLVGSLVAGYTFCGYDASAHIAEETTNAQISAPQGIVHAITASWVGGFILLAGMLLAIQDYAGTLNSATGVPPAQIFLDVLGTAGAKVLLLVVIVAMLLCGNSEVGACTRMVYAFSRSGALPKSEFWRHVSSRTKVPTRAVWFSVFLPFVLALPALKSLVAYGAITAINAVGMLPACTIPVYLALRKGKAYRPGPWTLGAWRKPIAVIACLYAPAMIVVFCLPQVGVITTDTFNYAPVTLAVALLLLWAAWVVQGRKGYQPTGGAAQPAEALIPEGDGF